MIVGTGCDLMDIKRVAESLQHDPVFAKTIFTDSELSHCRGKHYPERHLAARFAAKEALLKALPGPRLEVIPWKEIETKNDQADRPILSLSGSLSRLASKVHVSSIHLSLSHTNDHAFAVVVLESAESLSH